MRAKHFTQRLLLLPSRDRTPDGGRDGGDPHQLHAGDDRLSGPAGAAGQRGAACQHLSSCSPTLGAEDRADQREGR